MIVCSYFDAIDANPYAYNSGGIKMTIDRAGEKASAAVERYGGKDMWPPYQEDPAPNGNMIEPNDIAKRFNICGDPKLVRLHCCQALHHFFHHVR